MKDETNNQEEVKKIDLTLTREVVDILITAIAFTKRHANISEAEKLSLGSIQIQIMEEIERSESDE